MQVGEVGDEGGVVEERQAGGGGVVGGGGKGREVEEVVGVCAGRGVSEGGVGGGGLDDGGGFEDGMCAWVFRRTGIGRTGGELEGWAMAGGMGAYLKFDLEACETAVLGLFVRGRGRFLGD